MSLEPHIVDRNRAVGWVEVICGSMFSGKTEELIRRLRRARIARQATEAFKPAIDTRSEDDEVVSHDENSIATTSVHSASQILPLTEGVDVVGIDEAQFFEGDLVQVCRDLAARGIRVIVTGLDQDYRGKPFDPIPQLMATAEHVTKLHAVCVVCGAPANHSQRIVPGEERVLVGATEAYEPRCRTCFEPHPVEVDRDHVEAHHPETTVLQSAAANGEASAVEREDMSNKEAAGDDGAPGTDR